MSKIAQAVWPSNNEALAPAPVPANDEEIGEETEGGKDEDFVKDFTPSVGLTSDEAAARLLQYGRNELEEKETPKWYIFVSQLWQPMPIMIWIAALVEAVIENWADMAILLFIQFANATLSFYEVTKAGNAVKALKNSLKPEATVKRDGKWMNIDAALVVPGDLCLLASGSTVPADTIVNHGNVEIDQSALTGESVPVKMFPGSVAKMGSTIVKGEVESTVRHTGSNTFFGRTALLLQQKHELSNLQKLLIKIMAILVVVSLVLCAIVFGYLAENHVKVRENLSFTVVLLVASIPIAIEIVCTTTLALGSKQLAKHGAIVTRLAAIEDLAGVSILCSDKTGTLTMNKMVIQSNPCIYWEGENQESLLLHAAMAAKWREPPRDALDTMVLTQAKLDQINDYTQLDYMPFDPRVKRTEGTVRTPDGKTFKVTKGAPNILLSLCNDAEVATRCKSDVHKLGESGTRCLAVAKTTESGEWKMLGLLTFLDPERPDSKLTIEQALDNGVEVKMITGDHLLIAREMARRLGLGNAIHNAENLPNLDANGNAPKDLVAKYGQKILMADGFAQVYPEHKFLIVETLRQFGYKIGMTGDGVNDAPALKRADVGIAVQGATDAARAAADIVLTKPGLSTIIHGLVMSRCIFIRMRSFLTYRIAATLQLLVFFFIAVLAFHPKDYQPDPLPANWKDDGDWPDFFHLPVLMLMLITLLNDGTLIAIGYDNVIPSRTPQVWNIPRLFTISISLAIFACGSSLLLLHWALDSWSEDSFLYKLGLKQISYGQIITMMYLKVSVSDFLTLFASRAHNKFFWKSRPATSLLCAACLALSASTIVSTAWPISSPDGIRTEGMGRNSPKLLPLFVWIYSIIWWFLQDLFKVLTYHGLKKLQIFQNKKVQVANVQLSPKTRAAREFAIADMTL